MKTENSKKKYNLVIVESPTKVPTLGKLLGNGYMVKASVGHVRDLPEKKLGIEIGEEFIPQYTAIKGKTKILKELKDSISKAERILLAADPDREGEAICWHLKESLDLDNDILSRVLIYELTAAGVEKAFSHPQELNQNKVDAQQTRRLLDRLVGYKVSPLLWRIVRKGLSAGRVQTVALRLVNEREEERESFNPEEYWTLDAGLSKESGELFKARLEKVDGKKPTLGTKKDMDAVLAGLEGASYSVSGIQRKETTRRPPPPLITSTLQQEASTRLRFTPRRTMRVAQQLYEGVKLPGEGQTGLITYMRTDSVRLSGESVASCRKYIGENFPDNLPGSPRRYKGKSTSQDAHEAIRPTNVFLTPASLGAKLKPDELKLYSLIWSRFVACQMKPRISDITIADITGGRCLFKARGSIVRFRGFTEVYAPTGKNDEEELPALEIGEHLALKELLSEQHFTKPPSRYTEASLIKELESRGIGRPSTYAAIVSTILTREYVVREKGKLVPSELGRTVTRILIPLFPDLFDSGFTAEMETHLDHVESGKEYWQDVIRDFYGPFEEKIEQALKKTGELKRSLQEETEEKCENCGKNLVLKWGRHGKFLACPGFPECRFTKPLEEEGNGAELTCGECNAPMTLKHSRFGRFYSCSRYPDCKFTQPYTIGVGCPEDDCNGNIVEKKSAKGRVFYSCSNYPECKFSSWSLPVPGTCPHCGYQALTERKKGQACLKCKKTVSPDPAVRSTGSE